MTRIVNDKWNARTKIAHCGIPLPPGVVLKKLHPVIGVDDDYGIFSQPTVLQVRQHFADLIIEFRHATVVQIDNLVEIEFLFGRTLPTNNLERIGESRHRELGFARIGRIGEARIPRPRRGKGRMRGGIKYVQKKRLRMFRQARHQTPRTPAQ